MAVILSYCLPFQTRFVNLLYSKIIITAAMMINRLSSKYTNYDDSKDKTLIIPLNKSLAAKHMDHEPYNTV